MEEFDNNSRAAGLVAYHLVNLILQEGCMIANAALESGRPREYLSSRVNVRSDLTYVIPASEDAVYIDTVVDNFIEGADNVKIDSETNHLVTSTPQKVADDTPKQENGQGDEFTVPQQNELSNSTSLFINHLFDISDVELGISDDTNPVHTTEYNDLPHIVTNVMDYYMNAALDAFHATEQIEKDSVEKRVRISGNSSFSYIEEVIEDSGKDIFYVDDNIVEDPSCTEDVYQMPQDPMTSHMALQCAVRETLETENSEFYENTYLTLNRDYDQCSDEEEFPILQDPKGMLMQEIVLLTANTSIDTGRSKEEAGEDIYIGTSLGIVLRLSNILATIPALSYGILNHYSARCQTWNIDFGLSFQCRASLHSAETTCHPAYKQLTRFNESIFIWSSSGCVDKMHYAISDNASKRFECFDRTLHLALSTDGSLVEISLCILATPSEIVNSSLLDRKVQREALAATSGLSAGSRKSGVVRRWRQQGARFLACLRGWWRRKANGKRKAAASPSQRSLSPSALRRSASLLAQRPPAVTSHAKCNTINEALLNSCHWMDYTFEDKPNDCGDV